MINKYNIINNIKIENIQVTQREKRDRDKRKSGVLRGVG